MNAAKDYTGLQKQSAYLAQFVYASSARILNEDLHPFRYSTIMRPMNPATPAIPSPTAAVGCDASSLVLVCKSPFSSTKTPAPPVAPESNADLVVVGVQPVGVLA